MTDHSAVIALKNVSFRAHKHPKRTRVVGGVIGQWAGSGQAVGRTDGVVGWRAGSEVMARHGKCEHKTQHARGGPRA